MPYAIKRTHTNILYYIRECMHKVERTFAVRLLREIKGSLWCPFETHLVLFDTYYNK